MGVRLAAFNLPSIAKLTMTDELHLQELGERKIALFCCIPDSDKSPNSCKCSSSVIVSLAMDGRLNAARRTPTLTKMDLAVLPAACLKMRYYLQAMLSGSRISKRSNRMSSGDW